MVSFISSPDNGEPAFQSDRIDGYSSSSIYLGASQAWRGDVFGIRFKLDLRLLHDERAITYNRDREIMDSGVRGIDRLRIISSFPLLALDVSFAITSDSSRYYNCISWAYGGELSWMWPYSEGIRLDPDVRRYWPQGIPHDEDISTFIRLFTESGYRECCDHTYEAGYEKVALYVDSVGCECTHASRQLLVGSYCGTWTSKLGFGYDIRHGSPYGLAGVIYGSVHCIMRRAVVLP